MVEPKRPKIDVEVIAGRLWAARKPDNKFDGWEMDECASLLESAFPFARDVPVAVRGRLVRKAIFAAGRKERPFTEKFLVQELRREQTQLLAQPFSTYTLVSALSLESLRLRRRLNGATIRVSGHLPRKYGQAPLGERFKALRLVARPAKYSVATVTIKERDGVLAFHRAAACLDLLRGIWNLLINQRVAMSVQIGGPPKPVNVVRCGQVHTLHDGRGNLAAGGTFWSEPDFSYFEASCRRVKDWDRVLAAEKQVRAALQACRYREDLASCIVRYTRILDGRDMEAVFLKLWSLLETLTATAQESYSETIERTAFVFGDRDVVLPLLEHLRSRRNLVVHHAEEPGARASDLVYQLKLFVEILLRFHLGLGRRFPSMAKAGEFLGLPVERAALENEIKKARERTRLLSRALAFQTPKKD